MYLTTFALVWWQNKLAALVGTNGRANWYKAIGASMAARGGKQSNGNHAGLDMVLDGNSELVGLGEPGGPVGLTCCHRELLRDKHALLLYSTESCEKTGLRALEKVLEYSTTSTLPLLVPGVIAVAVDFATGAIYLPPETAMHTPERGAELRTVQVDPAALTPELVAAVVRDQTGKAVSLQPGEYRAMKLQRLDQFTPETVAGLQVDAHAARVIFPASDE